MLAHLELKVHMFVMLEFTGLERQNGRAMPDSEAWTGRELSVWPWEAVGEGAGSWMYVAHYFVVIIEWK